LSKLQKYSFIFLYLREATWWKNVDTDRMWILTDCGYSHRSALPTKMSRRQVNIDRFLEVDFVNKWQFGNEKASAPTGQHEDADGHRETLVQHEISIVNHSTRIAQRWITFLVHLRRFIRVFGMYREIRAQRSHYSKEGETLVVNIQFINKNRLLFYLYIKLDLMKNSIKATGQCDGLLYWKEKLTSNSRVNIKGGSIWSTYRRRWLVTVVEGTPCTAFKTGTKNFLRNFRQNI
jgi:hypothetical protein